MNLSAVLGRPSMRPSRCLLRPLCLAVILIPFLAQLLPEATCFLQGYLDCHDPSLLRCGGEEFNVSYPFLAVGRKGYCGIKSHFQLSCRDGNTPVIDIGRRSYRVKHIEYEAGILGVADLGASLKQECPLAPYGDATSDWSPFEYTRDNINLTLYNNCTTFLYSSPNLCEVPCLAHRGRWSYVINPEEPPIHPHIIDFLRSSCNSTAIVPLGGVAARSLKLCNPESLRNAMEEGFNLRWTTGYNSWCRVCVSSGGVCGYNSNTGSQICFCSDKTSTRSCSPSLSKGINKLEKIAIGVGAGMGVLLIANILYFLVCRRKMMTAVRTGSSTPPIRTTSLDPKMPNMHCYPTHLFTYSFATRLQ